MKRFDQRLVERMSQSLTQISTTDLMTLIRPKTIKILTEEQLKDLLSKERSLRIKFGIDPTAVDIHLGHLVPIMLLNLFVRAGHHVDFIIGDFTARVGDPTDRTSSRVMLTPEKIVENMQTYSAQLAKFLDINQLSIHHNADWLNQMPLTQVFSIFQQINLSEAMQREDFRERLRNDKAVSLAEVCYGVLMGIDSVHLNTQVEIGGIDQLLNFQQARKIMRQSGIPEEVILMTPILEGTTGDGRKMSKSLGNYVAVNATAEDKFGKIMSIPDRLVLTYFLCFGDVSDTEIEELQLFIEQHPLEAKKQLGTLIVSLETKNIDDGLRERENFERKFSKKEIANLDCQIVNFFGNETIFDVLMASGQFKTTSELRRLFDQNAVREQSEGTERTLERTTLANSITSIVRVGKRKFFQLVRDAK